MAMSFNLEHHFLIAMPEMDDPYFNQALVYIIQHDADGAVGLIVNKPVGTTLHETALQLGLSNRDTVRDGYAHYGGPVSRNQALILSTELRDDASSYSGHGVSVSGSREQLENLLTLPESIKFLLCMGYTGWSSGQIEAELEDQVWIASPATIDILFHPKASEKRAMALQTLGINPAFLK